MEERRAAEKNRRTQRLVAGGVGAVVSVPIAPDVTRLIVEVLHVFYEYDMPVDIQLSLCAVIGASIAGIAICFRDISAMVVDRWRRGAPD